jgi:uncharacterized phage protein (TIGR02218 family)
MKQASAALIEFLENADSFCRADLYTITLIGGGVLRYTSAGMPIVYGGETFNIGAPIQDGGVQSARGTSAGSVDITILGDERWQINGEQMLEFVENFGLDGATFRIDRVFAADWIAMAQTGPVGGYNRFYGRVAEVKELGLTQAVVTCNDFRDCLQAEYPKELYQTSCINTFGDANCGVNLASLQQAGQVAQPAASSTSFQSSLALPDGYLNLGTITFTSGPNAGISRSVKSSVAAGNVVNLTAPVPANPAPGDSFVACPGCQLSVADCTRWQGSAAQAMLRYRGQPFIPPPATGLPS